MNFPWDLLLGSSGDGKTKKLNYWLSRCPNCSNFRGAVAINFGFFKVRLPLIVVLVVMVIIGMIIAWFFGRDSQEHKAQNKVAFLNKNKKKTE